MAISHSYAGYNTAGGTDEGMTQNRVYAKKITLASAAWITSIGAHVKTNGTNVGAVNTVLYLDTAGTPSQILAYSGVTLTDVYPQDSGGTTYRWVHRALSYYATAGDYWIAVMDASTAGRLVIAKDGSGSDRYYTAGGAWFTDWGFTSPTTTTDRYSIRASLIS
jgi:hypothetical protein